MILIIRFWHEVCPDAAVVGVFRRPQEAAGSLMRRDRLPAEDGYNLWLRSNRQLLDMAITAREKGFRIPLIEFGSQIGRGEFLARCQDAAERVGLTKPIDPELFRGDWVRDNGSNMPDPPAEVTEVYERLVEEMA